jgi:hypothetical protein
MRKPFPDNDLVQDNEPFPNNLSAEDLRVLRRWRSGLFLFYGAILVIGVCLVSWRPQPPAGSNEIASAATHGSPTASSERNR